MTRTLHTVYIGLMVLIVLAVSIYLALTGYSYYSVPLEERFYHPQHDWFKPSGIVGHGLGIAGTFLILFGVGIYIARKRYNFLAKLIRVKYLLEFHIFLCTLGPILILFHTAFKFGGIVSVAFWSMVAVVSSGVIGRFVYIQIPRSIEGRELTLNEVKGMKMQLSNTIQKNMLVTDAVKNELIAFTSTEAESSRDSGFVAQYFDNRKTIGKVKNAMKRENVPGRQRASIIKLVREEISLGYKIKRLQTMQKLFRYWHVAHMPFALIMLVILIIHVAVSLSFGNKWIF